MIFPIKTMLGNLKMLKTYDYYDYPRFFSCENDIGRKYVGLSVEDGEGVYVWLYVHISNSRLKDMEAGKIELYDIFKKTEDNFVFEVKTFDVGADKVSKLVCDDISDYLLPHKGTTL